MEEIINLGGACSQTLDTEYLSIWPAKTVLRITGEVMHVSGL